MSRTFTDDTELDAIAAQVRAFGPLSAEQTGRLLGEARDAPRGPATDRLVEQQLGAVLEAVLARRGRGVEVMDLYQEGSIAATVAVGEYAAREAAPAGLRAYVAKVVDRFLDEVVERAEAQRVADALLIENLKLLEAAEVVLRLRLEREPTTLELAAALNWTPEVVDLIGATLHQARDAYDAEIAAYLDDVGDDLDDGGGD